MRRCTLETRLGANQHAGEVRQNGEPAADRFTTVVVFLLWSPAISLVSKRKVDHPATARLRLFRGWQSQKSQEDFAMKSLAYATLFAFALTPSYGFAQRVTQDERRRAD